MRWCGDKVTVNKQEQVVADIYEAESTASDCHMVSIFPSKVFYIESKANTLSYTSDDLGGGGGGSQVKISPAIKRTMATQESSIPQESEH